MSAPEWEKTVIKSLRSLDPDQRIIILGDLRRAVIANEVIAKAGGLSKVRPVPEHRRIRAYGLIPPRLLRGDPEAA